MRILLCLAVATALLLDGVVAPPVTANKKEDAEGGNEVDGEHKGADWDIGLEYNRYLQEVVQALESDPEFREKLEKAEVADIRTGKIASELEFVSHNVRSKLDELKRQELERLRHLAIKQAELQRQQEHHNEESDSDDDVEDPNHVDHENPHTFEVEDLRKLIVQTTRDLEEADKKRREEFKEYEMQKEFEKHQQLNLLDEDHKKKMEEEMTKQEQKHKEHPNLHHPGSKSQLEEVWEEQDHMNPEDFNPKTFFHMHDLDGNGFWDADEVKALFQKELDKMYDPTAPEDDMRERREEMERMREHVFNETDVNKDRLISYQEFLDQTKKQEFDQDPGWDGLDKQEVYTHEEYEQFEKRRQAEVQQMIQQGLLPPAPDLHLPYGMQVPPEYIQQQHQQNMQYQQNHQIPPHAQAQYHPQGGVPIHPGQVPQYQGHQQGHPIPQPGHQVPAQGYHPPPVQQQQQGYHAPPQQVHQQHPNAVPNQNYQGHPNQPPPYINQGQVHPNQGYPNQGSNQQHPNAVPNQQHPNQNYQNMPPQGQPPVHPNQGQGYQNQPPNAQAHQNQPNQVHQNQPPPVYQNQPPNAQVHQNQPPNAQVHQNQPNAQVHQNQPNQVHQNQPNQVHQNQPNQVHQNQPPVYQNPPPVQNQQAPVQKTINQVNAAPVHENTNQNAAPAYQNQQDIHSKQADTKEVHNEIPSHDSAGSQQH